MNCQFCNKPDVGSIEFETGNNAEYRVSVPLCVAHIHEAEDTGYDFEEKYAEQILECFYEQQRASADAAKDEF